MKFVLFHGAFGSPEGNWFPELKDKLESLGQEVIVPRFPVDDWQEITRAGEKVKPKKQSLNAWLDVFDTVGKKFTKADKLCFIGHSLGPLFILHAVDRFNILLDSAIFVSPFMDTLHRSWQIDHVNKTFYKTDFDFEKLKKLIPVSYVLYSNDDPYVDKNHSILFGKALDSSMILVKRAGHMNSEVNLNEFPLVLDLCITRLDLSFYQRYLSLRDKLGLAEYVNKNKGSRVKLDAEEAIAEGVFRFRNLKHSGFFTFFTALTKFWDPHSQYMKDARLAAQRGKQLTRVFIIEKITDLDNELLLEQISLDFTAGIEVYLCAYSKVKDVVEVPDFGITDDSYVCLVPYDRKTKKVQEIELNSSDEAMARARQWQKVILEHAVKIRDPLKDIARFRKNHS